MTELVANTEFEAQAIDARNQPTPPIYGDGKSMDAFLKEEQRRAAAGEPSQNIPDDPATEGLGPVSGRTQMFKEAEQEMMFARPRQQNSTVAPAIAGNDAYSESLVLNDVQGFERRNQDHLAGGVFDATLETVREQQKVQMIDQGGILTSEYFDNLSTPEKFQALATQAQRLDYRKITPLDYLLIQTFLGMKVGAGDISMVDFNKAAKSVSLTDVARSVEYMTSIGRRNHEWDILEVAAAAGWDNTSEAVAEIALTDLTPVYPLVVRTKILDHFADAVNVDRLHGWRGWAIGEYRHHLRKELTDMGLEEFAAAAAGFNEMFKEWERDPIKSKLLVRYALREQMEAVWTEDVFDGKSAMNTGDRWLGNFESLLEGIFSIIVIAKGAKSFGRAMSSPTSAVAARNAANAAGNSKVTAALDELVQQDEIALKFGGEADEAVPAMLPRPPTFVDRIENLPDGVKDVAIRNERVRSEIMESTDGLTGSHLTQADRTNVVNETIRQLDLADGAHVQGRMNVLQPHVNETGFNLRVVVGESAEGGYKELEDVLKEAINLDPELEKLSIMRINNKGVLEPVFKDTEQFHSAVFKGEVDADTAQRLIGDGSPDGSYYIVYDVERFWHTIDKAALGPDSFQSTGILPRSWVAPNARFGDEIYGNFLRAYMDEQTVLKNFEILFEPYYKLPAKDKQFVAGVFEWSEDFGKNHGRAPTYSEVVSRYDGISEDQINGIMSLRDGMDTMHELFNRRLYRDWHGLGYKTARPNNPDLPTFHGNALERELAGGGQVLDPDTGKMVDLTKTDLDDLYNDGGRIIELDMAVDAAHDAGNRATRVIARSGVYEVGELSTKPLQYHPGYSMRFYDDPYFIVKEQDGIKINGAVTRGASSTTSEAIRTAGTQAEAEAFAKRAQTAATADGSTATFKVVRANDLTQSESTLFQKESIHREGRLFWDNRNFDRLPDVNGNRATLEDPVKSLERGVGLAARQLTHEDPIKSLKNAWRADYGNLIPDQTMVARFDLKELSNQLGRQAKNTVDTAHKLKIKQAKELLDYLRLIEGTESAIIPWLREAALSVAVAINRTGLNSKRLETFAQTMDPFRAMRSVAFNAFMVFRPVRQALLQSAQIGYLAALNPKYVASPQFFKDAFAMRRGLTSLRKSGFDDGFSVKSMAKSMKLSEKEYRVLLREFDRSGLIDLVDVHSFSGGAGRFRKTALPSNDSPLGTIGYKGRQFARGTRDWFQNVGFNFGERNNLTFTWNLALKRTMDKKGYKSLLEMTRSDWTHLKTDASNLALGMVRPNSFGYQTGAIGTATQFLAFSHKAALGLLGLNPAISKLDALKIIGGTYLLYGANMYGGRDMANEILVSLGISNRELGDTGISVVDLISAGIIENATNVLGQVTMDDYKPVDLGPFAPGVDLDRFYEMQLKTILSQPTKAAFGPFGNIASKTLQGLEFTRFVHEGLPDLHPADKFALSAKAMMSSVFPLANDALKAYYGYQMDQWYSTSGEALPLRPTMSSMLSRGLFGIRTREELAYYRLKNKVWEDETNFNNARDINRQYLSRIVSELSAGKMTMEAAQQNIGALVNLYEEWPEGQRLALLRASMEFQQNDSLVPSVYRQLIEAMKNQKVDATAMLPLIDLFVDIPVDKREQLKKVIIEAHEGSVAVDAEALDKLKEAQ